MPTCAVSSMDCTRGRAGNPKRSRPDSHRAVSGGECISRTRRSAVARRLCVMPYALDILVLALFLFLGILLLMEAGRRVALHRAARHPERATAGLGAVEGAVFDFMGLLVAFTFSGAASRFDARRGCLSPTSSCPTPFPSPTRSCSASPPSCLRACGSQRLKPADSNAEDDAQPEPQP